MAPTPTGREFLQKVLELKSERRLNKSVGEGTFIYTAGFGIPGSGISIWDFKAFNGLETTGDPQLPFAVSSNVFVVTAHKDFLERLGWDALFPS